MVALRHAPRDYKMRRALAAGDAVGIVIGLLATTALSRAFGVENLLWGCASLPLWGIVFRSYGLYDRDMKRVSHSTLDDLPRLLHGIVVSTVLLWLLLRITPPGAVPFKPVAVAGGVSLVAIFSLRVGIRLLVAKLLGPERCLLIGDRSVIDVLARKMRSHPEYNIEPVGLLTHAEAPAARSPLPVVGDFNSDLGDIAQLLHVERVVIAHDDLDRNSMGEIMHRCRELGLKVSVVPRLSDTLGPSVEIDDVEGITMLAINPPVLSRSSRMLKRTMDIVGAGMLLLITAPMLAVIAILIRLTSTGPVLFRQRRIGESGRCFDLLKFRTMHAGAEAMHEELRHLSRDPDWLIIDEDPRITRIGHHLRQYSLDELPQLWNVVKGEMSLVGPRPLIPSEDSQLAGWRRSRADLTPGLTGLWQVLGRTRIPFEEMIKLDYLYLTNWSLWTDVRLILRTVPAVMFRRGAN
jgi:exopolysaccharide biosynthesis polyprenyl glycosylphosphotransferase